MPTKVRLIKAVVFPVVMYGCKSWTIKKAEHRRTDAFELWCWRLLRVPWTARRSNQSVLNIHRKEWCWSSAAILWPPDPKNWLTGKHPDAGKDWRQEEKGMTEDEMVGWHHRLLWTWVWASSGSWWWTGKPGVLQSMGLQSWTRLNNWTDWLIPKMMNLKLGPTSFSNGEVGVGRKRAKIC